MNQVGERSKKKWFTKLLLKVYLENSLLCLNKHDRVYSGHFAQIMEFCLVHPSRKNVLSRHWTCYCQIVSSATQSCPTLCNPTDCSTSVYPVRHRLPELLKLMSIESVMSSNHLILCHPLLLLSVFPSIRVFSKESILHIRWPKYWNFSFSIVHFFRIVIHSFP